jgi:RNA-directed DNA polymerase
VASFDRVNHDKLMAALARRGNDKRRLRLIRAFLESGGMEKGLVSPVDEGTPQGGPLCSRNSTENWSGVTTRRLQLKVKEAKRAVARPQDRKFLGFSFTYGAEPKRGIAPQARHRCKQKVRELTRRTRGISLEQMTRELATYLRGWKSYFGFSQTPSVLRRLEEWIRRRWRSTIWKQWKRGKVRFAKLRQRNIDAALAAQTAGSPHGPWRLANSPALQSAFPLAYFDSLGLPRLFAVL